MVATVSPGEHGAGGDRHVENAAGQRREHRAFGDLLFENAPFGLRRLDLVGEDLDLGAQARRGAAPS
jgi:hypothetical protein